MVQLTVIVLAAAQAAAQNVDYARQVHPILATKCLPCHSQEKRSGGLSLATYSDVLEGGRSGAIVKPLSSKTSLIERLLDGSTEPRMPIGGAPLSEQQMAVLRTWIDQG